MATKTTETPILIVGGGPVGLSLAADLGWRGVPCILVEQTDGTVLHPKATAINARSMEFMRRWGAAEAVRKAATPEGFPHTALYCTSLTGFEIARIERPHHGGRQPTATSPEQPQRCNQLWLDPILRDLAGSYDSVTMRNRCRYENHVETEDGIVATVRDLDTDTVETIACRWMIDCGGSHSTIRRTLGIGMTGQPYTDYNLSVLVRAPELWTHHDKGQAALTFFVDAKGVWRTFVLLDGRELYRFALAGREYYDNPDSVDVSRLFNEAVGAEVPHEIVSVGRWTARDVVADSYRAGRVILAGDAAHLNNPAGGFGLNTGMGDAVDLGWKLAALEAGWGGPGLLDNYETERRPIAVRNVGQAAESHINDRDRPSNPAIAEDSEAGRAAREKMGAEILSTRTQTFITDGTALGYSYHTSPLCLDDGTPPPADTISRYHPTSRPGARAPHAWLAEGKTVLDLFGRGFTLLRFGDAAPDAAGMIQAFAARGVPLAVHGISDQAVCDLYERRLVLVRPDGHVAWRSDLPPDDPAALVDRVRGA